MAGWSEYSLALASFSFYEVAGKLIPTIGELGKDLGAR